MSSFANTIYQNKYAEPGETWADNGPGSKSTPRRVVENVMGPYLPELVEEVIALIEQRKFMPGGRYLYASGKTFHQTQNCLLLDVEDSREAWANLMQRITNGLMTGAGIGVVYSKLREKGALVKGMGGKSTGPLALMEMVNEAGRHIMQGGSRRSAIWAGLHWWHPDVFDFIEMKNWSREVRDLKEKDFNFPARMDGTNISVILDDDFFAAYDDETHHQHHWAHKVYWAVIDRMLTTGEPGFSVDVGVNAGESLRNAPVAGYTKVLTDEGYRSVADIVGEPTRIWTGKQWAPDVVFKETNHASPTVRVRLSGGRLIDADPEHPFLIERYEGRGTRRHLVSVDRVPASELKPGDKCAVSLPSAPDVSWSAAEYTLGWIYGDGSFTSGGGADLTLCSDESKACFPFMTGYASVNEDDGRGFTRLYFSSRQFTDRTKSWVPQSNVTPSFIAGLFDADGNYEPKQKRIRLASKHKDFLHDIRRSLESLGILSHVTKAGTSTYGKKQCYQLVIASAYNHTFADLIPTKRILAELGDYRSYRPSAVKVASVEPHLVQPVYCADVQVEEHSFQAEGILISNCTEITSSDDNDICNLGSLNLARIETVQELSRATEIATAFLLCGTLYSKVPYEEVADTRTRNRRLGLGVMGIAEWLAVRGLPYAPDQELSYWLEEYAQSGVYADHYADRLGISRPIKTRAIAPTGTIGILAETTTGIEPIFAKAIKRRYLVEKTWHFQYVIDASVQRIVEQGVDPDTIEDAYDLAKDPGRRLDFQAWVQAYVDHGISSTLNLPAPAEQSFSHREFGDALYQRLPLLRGVTAYPDGARGGQPLTTVPYAEAKDWVGYEYEEVGNGVACVSGACGI